MLPPELTIRSNGSKPGTSAKLCTGLAAMFITPTRAAVTGSELSTHITMVPSFFKARLESPPAAIFTTPFNPVGTVTGPTELVPHATTVPSSFWMSSPNAS